MAMIDGIGTKIKARRYEFSKHAVDQSIIRDISVVEVEEAIANRSEIIEDYPEDKYGPSCLILGFTKMVRPLHVQCGYPSRPLIKTSLCISLPLKCGSIFGSEGETKGDS